MTTAYDTWAALLRGERTKFFVDHPEAGYWRKPIKGKTNGGASLTVGYHPVAFYPDPDSGTIVGLIDGKPLTHEECCVMWSYCASHPITYAQYQAYAENPDREGRRWHDWEKINAAVARMAVADVVDPPQAPAPPAEPEKPAEPEHAKLLADIKSYEAQLDAFIKDKKKIESEEDNAEIARIRGVLAGLRLRAERSYEVDKAPHWKAYNDVKDRWSPVINAGKAGEAKGKRLQDVWETDKLQAEKERKQREEQEAARWADRAMVSEQLGEKPPPPPAPPAPNMPAPNTHTASRAGGGKKKVGIKKVVTITDQEKVYRYFADSDAIKTVLQQLAQAKVNAGTLDVPGINIEEQAST